MHSSRYLISKSSVCKHYWYINIRRSCTLVLTHVRHGYMIWILPMYNAQEYNMKLRWKKRDGVTEQVSKGRSEWRWEWRSDVVSKNTSSRGANKKNVVNEMGKCCKKWLQQNESSSTKNSWNTVINIEDENCSPSTTSMNKVLANTRSKLRYLVLFVARTK